MGIGIGASASKVAQAGLSEVVMGWAADPGLTFPAIRRRLHEEYDLDISESALHDFVTGQRDNRRAALAAAAASDPVLRDRLAVSATSDLDMLDDVMRSLYAAYQASHSMDMRVDVARALFDGWRTKGRLLGTDGAPTATATVAMIGGRRLPDISDEDLAALLLAARAPGVSDAAVLAAGGPAGVSLEAGAGLGAGAGAVPQMEEGVEAGLGAVAGPGASPEVLCRAAPGDGNRSRRE